MASPFLIQQVVRSAELRRSGSSLSSSSWSARGPELSQSAGTLLDRRASLEALSERARAASAVKATAAPEAPPQEGPLLRPSSRRSFGGGAAAWRPCYCRLDPVRGVLESWEGCDAPEPGAAPTWVVALETLLAVGQRARELHLVLSVPRRLQWHRRKRKVVRLRVPDGADFCGWLSALARHAAATGDV